MTINIQYIKQNLTGGLPERLALVHVPNIYIYIYVGLLDAGEAPAVPLK